MKLIKTSVLNGISVVVKTIVMLLVNKILAIFVGPAGYAMIGQLQNFILICGTFATGGITNGIVKYTSDNESGKSLNKLISTGFFITIISSFTVCLLVTIFAKQCAVYFLNDESLVSVFYWLASGGFFIGMNTFLLAILNGKKDITLYVLANIIGSLSTLAIVGILSYTKGYYGALVSLVIYQGISCIFSFYFCTKTEWFSLKLFIGGLDKAYSIRLLKYSMMALTSAIVVPLSHIFIRDYLNDTLGASYAGNWEAMWRLSKAYLMVIVTTLTVYYLPKLSSLKGTVLIKKEIHNGYKVILPITALMIIIMYQFRFLVVELLFTAEFDLIYDLFFYQVIGDFFKVGSFLLAFLMLAKAKVKVYIYTEIVFSLIFYFLTVYFVEKYGFEGAAIAHLVNYSLYWTVLYYYFFVAKGSYE
jgi:PST family polysaccharide transporter